jgi:hypothetical protein
MWNAFRSEEPSANPERMAERARWDVLRCRTIKGIAPITDLDDSIACSRSNSACASVRMGG